MPTINQLVRKGRRPKSKKVKAPALQYTLNAFTQKRTRRRKGAPQKRGVTVKQPQVYHQARRYRRMIGKAQVKVGDVATVELYLYEDEVPDETRAMLLKLLKTAMKAELDKMAAGADAPKK